MTRRGIFGLFAPQVLSSGMRQVRDVFTSRIGFYALSAVPLTSPLVFLNGLLMQEGVDYRIFSRTVSFTGQPVQQMDRVCVQIVYWA